MSNISISLSELNIMRQWFDSVQDVNPNYLDNADYILAKMIYEILGMNVPNRITSMVEVLKTGDNNTTNP
jgi:hypothetical protein